MKSDTLLPNYMKRHLELYESRGESYAIRDGNIFRPYKGSVRPYGPIKNDYTLQRESALAVLKELNGKMIISTDGITDEPISNWYGVICDAFTALDEYKAKYRSEIRRGLTNCQVLKIDVDYLLGHGYDVYERSFSRYQGTSKPDWCKAEFENYLRNSRNFDDIVHCWGVFHDDHLVGFGINNVFDKIEATYWMIKVDPEYLQYYPIYALVYKMNEYYLAEEGFEYVNDGWKSISHETGIQDFLIKKFGFKKAYSRLQINYAPWLSTTVKCAYPFRAQLSKMSPSIRSLMALEASCRSGRGQVYA